MVHPDEIEYQFGWWASCYKHPEARNNRDEYPDSISFVVGLDGGYQKSLFWNALTCSMCGPSPNYMTLWHDLLDNWEHYDAMFKQMFVDRYKAMKRYIEDRDNFILNASFRDIQKAFSVMENVNNEYLHLNVSINT